MIEEQKHLEKNFEHEGEVLESSEQLERENSVEQETDSKVLSDSENANEGDYNKELTGEKGASSPTEQELQQVIEILQQENALLKQQFEEQTKQLDAIKAQYLRNSADFENFRKRSQKEKEELAEKAKQETLSELLPAIDNFERARLQIKPNNDGEMAIHKSYQGVYKQLVDGLKKLGVSPMRPEGQSFDPNYHEAVFQEETDDHPEGTVIEQLQRGYLLGERVLRHAMVKVATAKTEASTTPEESTSPAENNLDSE